MAKIYIFNAAVDYDLMWLVIIAVINTAISAYYYLRVIKVMYLGAPLSEEAIPSSGALRAALSVACLGVLLLGVYPWALLKIAETAVSMFP
jgi:NADH-quinone oxidoreductase subunit N